MIVPKHPRKHMKWCPQSRQLRERLDAQRCVNCSPIAVATILILRGSQAFINKDKGRNNNT
jgi:hypothetical protein